MEDLRVLPLRYYLLSLCYVTSRVELEDRFFRKLIDGGIKFETRRFPSFVGLHGIRGKSF